MRAKKPLVFLSNLCCAVLAFLLRWVLGDEPSSLFASMSIALVLLSTACAPLRAISTEISRTRVGAMVTDLTYDGASEVFGGSVSYLNTWLFFLGVYSVFVVALIVARLITALVPLPVRKTRTVVLTCSEAGGGADGWVHPAKAQELPDPRKDREHQRRRTGMVSRSAGAVRPGNWRRPSMSNSSSAERRKASRAHRCRPGGA